MPATQSAELRASFSAKPEDPQVSALIRAFQVFEQNSHRLEEAFAKLQADFKNLNLELDFKNRYLETILQSLDVGVIALDPSGIITNFNRGAEDIWGVKAAEVVGRPYQGFLDRNLPPEQTPLRALEAGIDIRQGEKNLTCPNGANKPVSYTISLMQDRDNKCLGVVEVLRDLSDIKRMQDEMERSKTLAALGEMAATVAHEIRNPLGAIGGFAGLLEKELANQPENRSLVKKVIRAVASLNKIVSNLLVFTRPMRGYFHRMLLKDLVRESLDFALLGLEESSKYQIRRKFGKSPVFIRADVDKFHQLFLNLFQNAIQSMDSGGPLEISLKVIKAKPKAPLLVQGQSVDAAAILQIKDSGCGIPADHMEKIFNPFFTTKISGTGLGLAIVKKIVDLHQGEIKVQSSSRGTCIQVYFPISGTAA